jgi:hypothetical protein
MTLLVHHRTASMCIHKLATEEGNGFPFLLDYGVQLLVRGIGPYIIWKVGVGIGK